MENDYLPPSPLSYPGIWYLVGISRVVSGTWTPLATIVFSHDHFRELPCSARFHFLPALILPSPLLLQSKKPPNPFRERDRERERDHRRFEAFDIPMLEQQQRNKYRRKEIFERKLPSTRRLYFPCGERRLESAVENARRMATM